MADWLMATGLLTGGQQKREMVFCVMGIWSLLAICFLNDISLLQFGSLLCFYVVFLSLHLAAKKNFDGVFGFAESIAVAM